MSSPFSDFVSPSPVSSFTGFDGQFPNYAKSDQHPVDIYIQNYSATQFEEYHRWISNQQLRGVSPESNNSSPSDFTDDDSEMEVIYDSSSSSSSLSSRVNSPGNLTEVSDIQEAFRAPTPPLDISTFFADVEQQVERLPFEKNREKTVFPDEDMFNNDFDFNLDESQPLSPFVPFNDEFAEKIANSEASSVQPNNSLDSEELTGFFHSVHPPQVVNSLFAPPPHEDIEALLNTTTTIEDPDNGIKYVGDVDPENMNPHGLGEMFEPEGNYFSGFFFQGKVVSGFARTIYPDGSVHECERVGSKCEGYGVLRKPNGDYRIGQWTSNSFVEGDFRKTFNNGDVFFGKLKNGEYKGVMITSNGEIYDGRLEL